jgi:SAM-dependent methyltransferase
MVGSNAGHYVLDLRVPGRDFSPMAQIVEDLWGRIMRDYHRGRPASYAFRRDDGYLDDGHSPEVYFASRSAFFSWEADLLDAVEPPVLDVGAGPGRMALWAQEEGHPVVAVDSSPLTVEVARARGVKDVRLGRCQALEGVLAPEECAFGTVLLMGHNLGLGGTLAGLRELLLALRTRSRPGAALLATSLEFGETDHPDHIRYQAARREQGRYAGEVVIRAEYEGAVGPFFPWLLICSDDLGGIAQETGWFLERIVRGEAAAYGCVLRWVG